MDTLGLRTTTAATSRLAQRMETLLLAAIVCFVGFVSGQTQLSAKESDSIERGRYLTTIGACAACHTPPRVDGNTPPKGSMAEATERRFRTDPDWTLYLDSGRSLAGGVPFWLRFSGSSNGVVYSRNLTPDPDTGLGKWTDDEIVRVLREGVRKDGTSLFLFPPHTFYKNLALDDARAIVAYLRAQKPIHHVLPGVCLEYVFM